MPKSQRSIQAVTVGVDNFRRAESDLYFDHAVKDAGGVGKFYHHREPMPIDRQGVIRSNRDTLYSVVVIDLDAGPVTITLPDAGSRFRSMQVINEDHYVVGARWSIRMTRRTFSRSTPCKTQLNSPRRAQGRSRCQSGIRRARRKCATHCWCSVRPFPISAEHLAPGTRSTQRHLIGTAAAWGGNPEKDATYLNVTPIKNDGKTVHKLRIKDVPVDGFWSISVYNAEGYFVKNPADAYVVNNITAKKDTDGSVTIQFGVDDGKVPNCLPIMPGWNYTVRLYRPRAEIRDGNWKFPEAAPVEASAKTDAA